MKHYYKTTEMSMNEYLQSILQGQKQEEVILKIFKDYKQKFTAWEVNKLLNDHYPITSVRRAITNLTDQGYLNKTKIVKIGRYGKGCHAWEIVER
jgi:Fe2+ or Zn2+ uptake regulation protein